MTCNQDNEADEGVEDSFASLFDIFLISSRSENEPSSIDHEEYADEHEEAIDIGDDLPNKRYSTCEVLVTYLTGTDRDNALFLTIRRSIEEIDRNLRESNKKESKESIENRSASFFETIFLTRTTDDLEKSVDHHCEKCKRGEHLED